MTTTNAANDAPPLDTTALERWLDEHLPELGDGPVQLSKISGGNTNLVIRLQRSGGPVVARMPPLEGSPEGAKTIHREATVLQALNGTSVPHPVFRAYCPTPDVLGVPFYVMDLVDGWAATLTEQNEIIFKPGFESGPDHHYLGYAMIDGLAEMALLDYKAVGLESYGKPEGFLERQPDRWMAQVESYATRYPKYDAERLIRQGLPRIADWLRDNVPAGNQPGLMHADYAVSNVLFANRPPARLVAIIDWETSTIGDPLLDIAGFTRSFPSSRGPGRVGGAFRLPGFPTREDALAYYAERTGRSLDTLPYYDVLYAFRTACMIEYKVAESMQGLSSPAKGQRFAALMDRAVQDALALIAAS